MSGLDPSSGLRRRPPTALPSIFRTSASRSAAATRRRSSTLFSLQRLTSEFRKFPRGGRCALVQRSGKTGEVRLRAEMGKERASRNGGDPMPDFVRPLSPDEEVTIQQLLRSRTVPAGYYVRALIIHFSRQGETPAQIARRLEHKFDNVVKWIRRFNEEGLAGLNERPGRGRRAKIKESEALAVVESVLTPP